MRPIAATALLALLAACTTGEGARVGPSATENPSPKIAPQPVGPSAAAEMARLCPKPQPPPRRISPAAHVPPVVARIEREVEAVRGLRFVHPVAVATVTSREMASRVRGAATDSAPVAQFRRRQRAWETIGVLPRHTNLAGAVSRFLGAEAVGYYDSHAEELVYVG